MEVHFECSTYLLFSLEMKDNREVWFFVCLFVCFTFSSIRFISTSSGSVQSLSRVWLFATPWTVARQAPLSMRILLGKNTRVGCHSLLQGIFPIQGSSPGLWHCRQILYHLSHSSSNKKNKTWPQITSLFGTYTPLLPSRGKGLFLLQAIVCGGNDSLTFLHPGIKNFWVGFSWWLSDKESACQCGRHRFNPWSGRTHTP